MLLEQQEPINHEDYKMSDLLLSLAAGAAVGLGFTYLRSRSQEAKYNNF